MTRGLRRTASRAVTLLCCAIGVACRCYLFPVYWMFISGLKTSAEIFADPPSMVPRPSDARGLPLGLRAARTLRATCATAWRSRSRSPW